MWMYICVCVCVCVCVVCVCLVTPVMSDFAIPWTVACYSLACYSAGCRKESERTELLNNKNKMYTAYFVYVFIHSWIFDCFHHLLTIGSNAAMNVDVQLSLENRSFFLIACTYLFFKNFFLMENFKHVKK